MNTTKTLAGVAALGVLALQAVAPAVAQEAGTQEVHAYGGVLFGDDVTDRAISGRTLELDDDATFGVRYAYNLTDALGLELSLGHSPNAVVGLTGRDVDLNLTTLDADAVWNFRTGSRLVPYVLAGVGYASADLDGNILGVVGNQPVSIGDDNGFTANAGLGLKYLATDNVIIRAEGRYRYLDKVLDRFDDSSNAVEATLGIGWRF
jgi:outer membrane beta-barrel protein